MIILLVLILIVLTIVCARNTDSSDSYYSDFSAGWSVGLRFSIIILILVIVWGCITLNSIVGERTIDERITMYQEENTKIQADVSRIVGDYMNWEKETYDNVKNESPIVLVQLFPELKSSELVGRQIDLYIVNNDKIRGLREKKINIELDKFWLYFG